MLEKVGKFRGFQIFDFGPYTEIKNLENSEIFSTIVNSKECVLLEEVGNFRGFRVFDFSPYTEIENSENLEIFSRLINFKWFVLFEEVGNFRGFRVFDFGSSLKLKTGKLGNFVLSEFALFEEVKNF